MRRRTDRQKSGVPLKSVPCLKKKKKKRTKSFPNRVVADRYTLSGIPKPNESAQIPFNCGPRTAASALRRRSAAATRDRRLAHLRNGRAAPQQISRGSPNGIAIDGRALMEDNSPRSPLQRTRLRRTFFKAALSGASLYYTPSPRPITLSW